MQNCGNKNIFIISFFFGLFIFSLSGFAEDKIKKKVQTKAEPHIAEVQAIIDSTGDSAETKATKVIDAAALHFNEANNRAKLQYQNAIERAKLNLQVELIKNLKVQLV